MAPDTDITHSPLPPGTRTYIVSRKAESFYLIRNTGKIDEIGTIVITRSGKGYLKSTIKKKKLIKILKEFDPVIEQYLEAKDLNLKKREDLVTAILSVMNTGE